MGLDLAGWARDNAATVDGWLDRHGAVLFSGFTFTGAGGPAPELDPVAFAGVLDGVLGGTPAAYMERSSPRRELARGVFTSTEQPADQPIFLHNENAYQRSLPTRLAFGCVVAATSAGATPLADCRQVLDHLPSAVVDRFRSAGVRYTRVFGNGVGLSWQESFGTDDPQEVERYCAAEDIATSWRSADVLRTEQVRPALSEHPRTGEEVWLNHVGLFGPHGTPPAVRAALVDRLGAENLPLQVSYGDGAPIEDDVHAHIRDAYAAATVARPWRAGDVLVVDNLLVAHGREPFEGDRLVLVGMAGQFQPESVAA
ncbi:TauD/TfdA family dioxygenase [Goekera deserti]|uniref:TauD/TfdA family dioxygenase n=1 Tax=Goekera deserti TaxID=2497753 RepID=UPI00192EA2BC|nr:TauD/TfdA family dioxygenase [Goekera deserti]